MMHNKNRFLPSTHLLKLSEEIFSYQCTREDESRMHFKHIDEKSARINLDRDRNALFMLL